MALLTSVSQPLIHYDLDSLNFKPNFLRLVSYMLDKQSASFNLFRTAVDDAEIWDYVYGVAETVE